jgi:hypothetical protein
VQSAAGNDQGDAKGATTAHVEIHIGGGSVIMASITK